MTEKEFYDILKEEYKKVDWNNLDSIKRYNEFKRNLRHEMEAKYVSIQH